MATTQMIPGQTAAGGGDMYTIPGTNIQIPRTIDSQGMVNNPYFQQGGDWGGSMVDNWTDPAFSQYGNAIGYGPDRMGLNFNPVDGNMRVDPMYTLKDGTWMLDEGSLTPTARNNSMDMWWKPALAATMIAGGLGAAGAFSGAGAGAGAGGGAGAAVGAGAGAGAGGVSDATIMAALGGGAPYAPLSVGGDAALGASLFPTLTEAAGGAAGISAATAGAAMGTGGGSFLESLFGPAAGSGAGSAVSSLFGPGMGLLPALATLGAGIYGQQQNKAITDAVSWDKIDPWGAMGGRAAAGKQAMELLANPNSITNLPGYQAGIQAVNRGMGARGLNNSGNQIAGLFKYGGDVYNNTLQTDAQLAGATVNPTQAGAVASNALNQAANNNLSTYGMIVQGGGGLLGSLFNLFG